jgi:hypothetical protein
MDVFYFFLLVLAVENLADMLTTLDIFDVPRKKFQACCVKLRIPKAAKLAECKFCLSFWLCLAASFFAPPLWLVASLAAHRACQFLSEFAERYFNRWPTTVSATIQNVGEDTAKTEEEDLTA